MFKAFLIDITLNLKFDDNMTMKYINLIYFI